MVFVMLENKVDYRCYLCVFHSRDIVIFILTTSIARRA